MYNSPRNIAVILVLLLAVFLSASALAAETSWPSLFRYTLSLSSDEAARYQTSIALTGPVNENVSAKAEGWWIGGSDDNRAFVGDLYIDYTRNPIYLAGGRKFIVFGPAGLLVSPGIFGGEAKLDIDRASIQALTGTLQFTPGTGTTRFTYTGARAPSNESITAVRLGLQLTPQGSAVPITVGGNWVDILDDTGTSIDLELGLQEGVAFYGEAAKYNSEKARLVGLRYSDAAARDDGKAIIAVLYYRKIDIGFVPAAIGATSYFENQKGLAGGLYYQMNDRHAVGLFADSNDVIVTFFGNIPLR